MKTKITFKYVRASGYFNTYWYSTASSNYRLRHIKIIKGMNSVGVGHNSYQKQSLYRYHNGKLALIEKTISPLMAGRLTQARSNSLQ